MSKNNFILRFVIAFAGVFLALPSIVFGQFTVGGNASSLGGGCYQLTSASNSQAGYVYQNAAINLNEPFDYRYSVYLGNNNGGADGIVFALRGSLGNPYIGTGGGAIGFNGNGFTNSVGIEVDTWYNGNFGDLAVDHIGMFKNGTVNHSGTGSLAAPIQASASNGNVEDGNYHTLNIKWEPSTKKLSVYFDCDYRVLYQGDLIDSIFQGDSLVHWGFLGTTGGANNVQGFCFTVPIDSLVTDLEDATICAGDTVQLDAGSSTVSYSWSPGTGLSSTSVADPFAYPSTTTTYIVTATYQCDTVYDTATVTVLQSNFTTSAVVEDAACKGFCDGAIDLSINGGSGGYSYLWSTNATTQDVSGLCAGTYSVTVTDTVSSSLTYLCTLSDDWTVDEPVILTAWTTNISNTSCPDGNTCDAGANANASGGTAPYAYLWSSGEVTNQAQGLCADTNWVTITDVQGCDTVAFSVNGIPDSIHTTGYGDTLICITNFAAVVASTTGGTPPYSYIWTKGSLNGPVVSLAVSASVDPPITTTYFVQSTDMNGCVGDTSKVLVKVRPPLNIEIPTPDTICLYGSNTITASGIGGDSLYSYAWSNGFFGPTVTVGPNESTWYVVTVSDYCGSPAYVDSVYQQVGGYSPIRAKIRVEDDSICPNESVYLIARGYGGFGGPDEYRFKWNHTIDTNRIQFVKPSKTKKYIVTITDLCLSQPGVDTLTVFVDDMKLPSISPSPKEACAKNDVTIHLENQYVGYRYTWFLGEGSIRSTTSADSFFLHQFTETGCYDIDVKLTSAFNCYGEKHFPCAVRVLEQPQAEFDHSPSNPTNIHPFVTFENRSKNALNWTWNLDGRQRLNEESFKYEFNEFNSEYLVNLIAVSQDGCADTITKLLSFIEETTLYYPSSFSPNGDGKNEFFVIEGEAVGLTDFDLTIYDRWGKQVFRSNNQQHGWDGRNVSGELLTAGAYPFTLRYRNYLGELQVVYDQVIISYSGEKTGLR